MATLPAHMWAVVVRTLLRLEDDDVTAWARLSRVCGVWRAALAGDWRGGGRICMVIIVLICRE